MHETLTIIRDAKRFTFSRTTNEFIAEASSLELPPGTFPDYVMLIGTESAEFVYVKAERSSGELAACRYREVGGKRRLCILND